MLTLRKRIFFSFSHNRIYYCKEKIGNLMKTKIDSLLLFEIEPTIIDEN